jgi:hypothetical protein
VKLSFGDVRVAADGGEVGVAEVVGYEPRVAGRLPEPGRGGVAEGVGSGALLESGAARATRAQGPRA